MRGILIATDRMPPDYTGAGLRAMRFSQRMSDRYNLPIKILCRGKNRSKEQIERITMKRIKTIEEEGLMFPIYLIQTFIKTNLYLMKNRKEFDIIHFFSFSWMNRIIMWSNILFYKKKTLMEVTLDGSDDPVSLLNDGKRNKLFKRFTKYLLKKIDKFIVSSRYGLKSCLDIGIDENKVVLLPHPCNKNDFGSIALNKRIELRKKLRLPIAKFIMLNVGAIYTRKNQLFLIECIKELKNQDIVLILIGPPSESEPQYLSKVEANIEKNKLKKQIIIVGPKININEYMIASDIFVFASRNEGFPNVIAESIMSGLPVITTHLDCISQYMNYNTGIMIKDESEYKQIKAFCNAINLVYTKEKIFNRGNIRKFGINNLSTEKVDHKFYLLYKELLNNRPANLRKQND